MFTQIITFAIIVAIIGCIMYGRKLIRTEKVDAVFGNPERAKGGTHWIIVGSSVILLTWLYYSWDIAKSFYPQSANELCQVGKVNDSLLSLKYLFPIEEREFKSTSIIKSENKNIIKLKNEIQNSKEISEQHRSFLIGLIDKTKSTIPLLTNENLLENQTKIKISELAGKIVVIPRADPGYDWLISCKIKGLITMFGGANSHMAIRCAELGITAAIGIGPKRYEAISDVERITIDPGNSLIRVL